VGATLGHGHFATVYRGVHRESGEQVAIKAIAKSRTDVSAIRREVAILQKVGSHRNVVALRDVFETEDEWYLVMELVTGGELFERLVKQGPYSEKEASRLMQQIGEGVDWLHSQGVCHRDLKPENLLLSEPNDAGDITVKICDFGLSVALGQEGTLDEKQGTWAYWAPEMFNSHGYGKEVDMWSLGVILYILLSGRHPFDAAGRTDAQMRKCIQTGQLSFAHESWREVSGEAKALIRSMLRQDPRERLSPAALLASSWIVGTGVSEVPIQHSDTNLKQYQRMRRKWSTALVASMHKQAVIRKRLSERQPHGSALPGSPVAPPRSIGSSTGSERGEEDLAPADMELLADAFKVFDPEGKGYVLASDLEGVIRRLGQQVTADEVTHMIAAMDARGSGKIHYKEYLNLASTTIKDKSKVFPTGTVIFREGEPSDYFYLITSGRVRRINRPPPARYQEFVASQEELCAGDYFGTSAILGSGERKRHSTMIAVTDVRVVRLGRDDFEAGQSIDGRTTSGGRSVSDVSRSISEPNGPVSSSSSDGSTNAGASSPRARRAGMQRDSSSSLGPARRPPFNASRSVLRSLRFINMMSNNEQRRYGRGDTLFREGEDARHMFIITSGRVQVACEGRDGRRKMIGQRGAGECCGETSCLSHKPRNSTVTCVSEGGCEVMCVTREDFLALVRGSWDVAQDLIAVSERHEKEKERRVNFRRTRDEVTDEDEDEAWKESEEREGVAAG